MTEEEKREKELEEIVRKYYNFDADLPKSENIQKLIRNGGWSEFTFMYDIGYRKAEEVRKETAKKFLKILYDMGVDRQTVETCGNYDVNGSALARFVSQEFGVEVDE